jgi:hypothetical protein
MGFLAAAAPFAPAIIGAAGSAIGGAIGAGGNKETKLQRQRRKLIDELLGSLRSGSGPFSDLFASDQETFEKGFAEPARQRFRDRGAPMIQQKFINAGLQRGTGLDDELARAGVDLESEINKNLMQYEQSALDRKMNILKGIMGGSEAGPQTSPGQGALEGLAGYAASPGFQKNLEDLFKTSSSNAPRTGYSSDWASMGAGAAGTSGY